MRPFRLQVLCPLNISQVYIGPNTPQAVRDYLVRNEWHESDSDARLEISKEFSREHTSWRKDITPNVEENIGTDTGDTSLTFERCELIAYKTGILFLCSSYQLTVNSLHLLNVAYKELVKKELQNSESSGHVTRIYEWINKTYSDVIGILNPKDTGVMQVRCYSPGTMNWTHAIFQHVTKEPSKFLSERELRKVCRGDKIQEHTISETSARALFGWETTAISTTHEAEAVLLSNLVRTMAYIWEIQWVISTVATDQLRSVARKDDAAALQRVRDFRRFAAVLMASCHPSRLSMVERHFYRASEIMKEWHLSDLSDAIKESTDLLDAIYTHAQQERTEERLLRLTIVLALLAFFTLVSVTKDAADFIETHKQWRLTFRIMVFFPALFGAILYFLMNLALTLRSRYTKTR